MELVKWDEIERQIAIEKDISILKTYHAALGSKEFRRQIDGSIKAINKCEKYKIKIEIAFGEYYKKLEDEKGENQYTASSTDLTTPKQQAETEIGKSRETINKYARMSSIEKTDELLEKYEAKCNDKGVEMSSMGFIKFAREEQHKDLPKIEMPKNKYRIIYADPPWKYNDRCEKGAIQSGGVEKHYPTMTINELCELELPPIDNNAILFIWTTSPLLEDSFKIINEWGFKYKASFIWDKIKHNMGHYNSVRHEFLLIATKGSCTPDNMKLYDSVQSIEKTGHSVKPEKFRNIIDELYPKGERIELFARRKIDKWDTW